MKLLWSAVGTLILLGLACSPTVGYGQAGAIAKVKANIDDVSKTSPSAKIKRKAKNGQKGKIRKAKTKRARVRKSGKLNSSVLSSKLEGKDDAGLDKEIAMARRIVIGDPGNDAARERLAQATVLLIDRVLRAEAVGDMAKANHLVQKIEKDLHDTGWRVKKRSKREGAIDRQAAGFLLARGILLAKDSVDSCKEFLASADTLPGASWHSAKCLIESTPAKAWQQMEHAANLGHAAAQEWMGRRCLGEFGAPETDYACARRYLEKSSMQGRPSAQALLAYLIVSDREGPPQVSRAVSLYMSAANKGDVNAQNNLGELYETGRGVAKDTLEAIRWYERAAESGLGSAQFNAGRLWAVGVGEKTDMGRARAYLVRAERSGVPQAKKVLDWLDQQLENEGESIRQ